MVVLAARRVGVVSLFWLGFVLMLRAWRPLHVRACWVSSWSVRVVGGVVRDVGAARGVVVSFSSGRLVVLFVGRLVVRLVGNCGRVVTILRRGVESAGVSCACRAAQRSGPAHITIDTPGGDIDYVSIR